MKKLRNVWKRLWHALWKRRIGRFPAVAVAVAGIALLLCWIGQIRDYPVTIRHTLREYGDREALLAVQEDMFNEAVEHTEWETWHIPCLYLMDKKGRIKCITEQEWNRVIARDESLADAEMEQAGWFMRNAGDLDAEEYDIWKEEVKNQEKTARAYDAVMANPKFRYQKQRIHLRWYYMTRLVNTVYPSHSCPAIYEKIRSYWDTPEYVGYRGMLVAYDAERLAVCYRANYTNENLLYWPDSPTTKYARKKLAELAGIGHREMKKRLESRYGGKWLGEKEYFLKRDSD